MNHKVRMKRDNATELKNLVFLVFSAVLLQITQSSPISQTKPWIYSRVKRQIFREEIPHHRPLTGNIYATHHGFPHPGRWHPRPQSILPPNPNSGHHFDNPNVIITDDDFNLYGSTLQHLDSPGQQHHHHHQISHHVQPNSQHPPPLPVVYQQPVHIISQGHGHRPPRKRRPMKLLVHHQIHPVQPHHYSVPVPVEYGKLVPLQEVSHGGGVDGPVLPIIAAHHHSNFQNLEHESPGLSYAQEYKDVVQEHVHVQKDHPPPPPPLPPHKVKALFHRLKFPPGFHKFGGGPPIMKTVWPMRYRTHDGRSSGKNGAFSWSIAY